MSEPLQIASISAPGFFGLNTQDSPLDLNQGFASVATNCIIDQYGRIGSRQGWSKVNAAVGTLGSNNVGVIHELVQSDGTLTILFAGNNKLFKLDAFNVVTELTYGGGGTAPTITANNWHCTSLNGITYFFQSTFNALIYDPAVSTTTFRRVTEKTGYIATVPDADICISAYGRLWAANTSTDKTTVFFSDLIAGHVWSTGTAGSLDVNRVWPNGSDEITGLAAHNGFLIIYGKRQILVYANATTPATMVLSDTVSGMGCISRDSIANTGKDVLFLSNSGVRSLARTITEKSSPLGDLSKNVRNDLIDYVSVETAKNIKSVYSEKQAFYLLTMPISNILVCFDTRIQLQDGSFRVTTWDSINPTALLSRRNGDLLIGKTGYIGKYGLYLDDTATYRLQYYTNNSDIGTQNVTSILKKLKAIIIGGTSQYLTIKWGFDFSSNYNSANVQIPIQEESNYNISEYGANATTLAQYTSGVALQELAVSASGQGKIVQTGYEADINNSSLSIQKIELQFKDGKSA